MDYRCFIEWPTNEDGDCSSRRCAGARDLNDPEAHSADCFNRERNEALLSAARLQTAADEFERWMVEEADLQLGAKQRLAIRGKQKDSLVAAAMEGALTHALEKFRALRRSAETTETGAP